MAGPLTFCISAGLLFSEELSVTPEPRPFGRPCGIMKPYVPWDVRNRYQFPDYLPQTLTRYLALFGFPALVTGFHFPFPQEMGCHPFKSWLVPAIVEARKEFVKFKNASGIS